MKKRLYRAAGFILAFVMILTTVVPALASENGTSTGKVRRETVEMEHGTMYFEETSDYAIAFTVYDNGRITYAVRYEENPDLIYSGAVSAEQNREAERFEVFSLSADRFALVDELLEIEATDVTDFNKREDREDSQRSTPDITTPAAALNYVKQYGPGFKYPVNYALIGTYYGTKTVQIYQTIDAIPSPIGSFAYYAGDLVETLFLAVLTSGLKWATLLELIPWVYNVTTGYILQSNGTLYLFKVENTRTRMACIDGVTYYWAGWDRNYHVYSGTESTEVEVSYNLEAADYNYGLDYWGEKAITNYNNYPGGVG